MKKLYTVDLESLYAALNARRESCFGEMRATRDRDHYNRLSIQARALNRRCLAVAEILARHNEGR